MPRYASPAPRASRRSILIAAAGAAAAIALILVVASLYLGSDARPGAATTPRSGTPTAIGAVSTVGAWLAFNDSRDELLDAQHRRLTVDRFASRSARTRLADELAQAAKRLQEDLAGPPATVRSAPLGYRVVEFSPARAVVVAWEVVLRGGLTAQPATVVAESRITLAWEDGWKVDRVAVEASPLRAWSSDDLATADDSFESFRHAP